MEEINITIIPRDKIHSILPILEKVDPQISRKILEERLIQMLEQNYQCIGVFHNERLIGISGIWILTKYYVGKHLEPDNVYLLPDYQGKGIGQLLIKWIEQYALKHGCRAVELNCYLSNEKGRKFWEKEGYLPLGMHFQKILKES